MRLQVKASIVGRRSFVSTGRKRNSWLQDLESDEIDHYDKQEILKNADAETKTKFKETLRQARNEVLDGHEKNLEFVKQKVGNT